MFVETMLPLGRTDSGLKVTDGTMDICATTSDALRVEALGFDGLAVQENKDDPYVISTLALQATTRLRVTTSVAIAFPRSPAVTAMTAWSLARLSGGRFVLGLGSQVKGHIERRFGFKWSAPGPWMRDYLQAIQDLWQAWQTGTPVAHHSAHYAINLNVPVFTPAPLTGEPIKIHLAAVNPYMCQVAGELTDGLRVHPICSPQYLQDVMMPAVRKGAARRERDLRGFEIAVKPLVATAADETKLAKKTEEIRGRIAFYGSTPAYAATFEFHGLGDLARTLNQYSRAQRWSEMANLISDEVVHQYAVVGTYDCIVERLRARYAGLASVLEFSIPVRHDADAELLRTIVRGLQQ
ncbi:MAG: TIGR03617 family F420-dependent LLM class oxidoreductase [Gammaproteobacteria bacterium]|nr:TIGR03617 family F420-dependent LLM class oxidoreductase [Gammaproteobacteria bacterium]